LIDFMRLRSRLADVARLAGVSTATVSAVVNHADGGNIRVSEETRQRVWEAVAQLGYVANPAARSLAGGHNRILGIFTYQPIFPFQHHDFFHPFLVGIEEEAEAQGYQLLFFTNVTNASGSRSIYHNDTNLLYMADGSILLGLNENKTDLRRLQGEGYPFVYIGRRDISPASLSYVTADYAAGTAQLASLLAGWGHRQVIFLGLKDQIEALQDREAGFLSACRDQQLPLDADSIQYLLPEEITLEWLQRLLERGVSAALVEYDNQARALHNALTNLGLTVPQDFSIAILGDPHEEWEGSPDWSMFAIPRREMGVEAVRLLVKRLEHPEDSTPHAVVLPCQIVTGQTIAAARQPAQKEVPLSKDIPLTPLHVERTHFETPFSGEESQ
jgi:LacI family transcriptional regulator